MKLVRPFTCTEFVLSRCISWEVATSSYLENLTKANKGFSENRYFSVSDYAGSCSVFMPAQETRLIGEGKSLAIWRNLKTRVLQVGDEKRNKDLRRERDNQDLS